MIPPHHQVCGQLGCHAIGGGVANIDEVRVLVPCPSIP